MSPKNTITVNDLSEDQADVYDKILGWSADPTGTPVMTLGGYAGSGKSTLVSLIADQVDLPCFCAYTGKASSVLKRKLSAAGITTTPKTMRKSDGMGLGEGLPYCGTIHSLVYRPCDCREPQAVEIDKPCPQKDCVGETGWDAELGVSFCAGGHNGLIATEEAFNKLKPKTKLVYAKKIDGVCQTCREKGWLRREALDRHYGLIIVDEASMVDDDMLRDLKSFEVPILAVGDHGQLPPVKGFGSLMKNPLLRLEKIHRQAEGNPIIALSKLIREEGRLPERISGDEVTFGSLRMVERFLEDRYADVSPERLLQMGVACYTNRRRQGLNVAVRRALGYARSGREMPQKGEHVICLRNMKSRVPPVYNGMRGVLTSDTKPKQVRNAFDETISESEIHIEGSVVFPEDGIPEGRFEMLAAQFGREKTFQDPEELAREVGIHSFAMAGPLFDFGYAMTVHKMQGSQFDDLVVCAERPGPVSNEDWRRWLYTAVTRASKKLTVLR